MQIEPQRQNGAHPLAKEQLTYVNPTARIASIFSISPVMKGDPLFKKGGQCINGGEL